MKCRVEFHLSDGDVFVVDDMPADSPYKAGQVYTDAIKRLEAYLLARTKFVATVVTYADGEEPPTATEPEVEVPEEFSNWFPQT
jgi:hypothetical protein